MVRPTSGLIRAIYLFLQSNRKINILSSALSFISSFLFILSFVLLYLEDFNLSNYTGFFLYNLYSMIDFVNYVNDKDY